jgi:arginine N-succinyltransferase
MLLFRPVRESDLPGLVALASSIAGGLTTLPANEEFLRDRIDASLRAFATRVKRPGGECYLFVLEDTATGEVVGTSGLAACVGGYEPFYSYEIRTERYEHAPLKIQKQVSVLHLKEVHRGPSEICSLYLRPDHRRAGAGRLLSLARFLFVGAFPARFDETIIAELRGRLDEAGRSPFWEAVGRQFFEFDFYAADFLSGLGDKGFIADLMPDHPIYIPLLPPAVQAVIGQVHQNTEPALRLLLAEGFERTNEVDIFDAGPLLRASTKAIRTIRTMRSARLRESGPSPVTGIPRLVARTAPDFRAGLGVVAEGTDGTVTLDRDTAANLGLSAGDTVTYAPLR